MPSSRAIALTGLATLVVILGVLDPLWAAVALALDLVLVALVLLDWWLARRHGVHAARHWPPLLVQGVEAELRVTLANPGSRPLRLLLREALHPALAEAPERTELELPASSSLDWSLRIRPRRRGAHQSGPLTARLSGPLRLAYHQRQLAGAELRRVYPQIRWEGRVGKLLLLAHRHALGKSPRRLRGLGSEPYALREYLRGDPPDHIHWKASARHGRLISREDTWEKGARLVLLLDRARGMSSMDGGRSKLDHALAAALALVRVAASRGDQVSVIAFSDRIDRRIRLHAGGRAASIAYAGLYDLESSLAEPAYDLAAEAAAGSEARRSTVMLFTSVVDLAAAALLKDSLLRLERRHRPILVNLEDPELLGLAYGAPRGLEQAYAKVSALGIVLANRQLARQLGHAGIRVLSTPADRLALETIDAYLKTLARAR